MMSRAEALYVEVVLVTARVYDYMLWLCGIVSLVMGSVGSLNLKANYSATIKMCVYKERYLDAQIWAKELARGFTC